MGRGSSWQSANLPPTPLRRHPTTSEERAEQSARADAELARYLHAAELRVKRKERTTDAQRARKAAQDDVRKTRAVLEETVQARRMARAVEALEQRPRILTPQYQSTADRLCMKLERRTRAMQARAAQGCEVSTAYLADPDAIALYREAAMPVAPVPVSGDGGMPRASST